MKNLAKENILKIKPYVPGKPIEEVKRELGLKRVIKLASNENPLPPSPRVLSAIRKTAISLNRYPDGGCFYLKKKIASALGFKPENVIVGNGSDEIIVLALRAFLKAGEEVVIADPTFLVYGIASRIENAKIKFVPLKDYRYDVKGIVKSLSSKTKLVFIANPDNPTGTYLTAEEVDYLVSKVSRNTLIFFDEAYFEFAARTRDYPRTLKYINRKNVIITRSFSKIYSLAGLRVGYGLASEKIIDCLNRVREPFNVNSMAQAAALAALGDKKHVTKSVALAEKGKKYLYQNLDSLGVQYIPSVTNFVLMRLGKNAGEVYKRLLKKGVIVREMRAWGLNDFMRVTLGTMEENRKFVRELKGAL